jgi:hypothetical protein
MGLVVLRRLLALAAVGVLAAVVALAIVEQRKPELKKRVLPAAVPAMGGGWYQGSAAPHLAQTTGARTDCGYVLKAGTAGIAQPVLGCGTKLFLRFGSHEVLTQVITQQVPPGVQFAVTRHVADLLGLQSTDIVSWRYAAVQAP